MQVSVQSEPFDLGVLTSAFAARVAGAGAVVTFTGLVRDNDGQLAAMEIEHYPGMTEKAITAMVDQATARWSLADALVVHRYGRLAGGEAIMMVATASRHRADAFAAAEFLMDYLKSRAPFWKKELSADGSAWVAAREEDETALKRW
ncbi:MAG: molybdenum cofactor biosynthesis protein MoaE [Cypionkella sp.]|uniref:molybdenum cofactor biosynthesis protein MoaE n=1 Tax=Cypionkella sp. TaxID=2811411 RepID=UPI002ABA1E6D|nr:molybdenum cofactor biosynthesis protein MoaE [Cypionkella sp.]MDZ4311722.1 molybdenum cofactor biosynthesis protein MoaE [Cypionkella sp.]MDZ4392936.1 molybdenum cofactor biosynthesis protein MoaE [Cypionkella sp.]